MTHYIKKHNSNFQVTNMEAKRGWIFSFMKKNKVPQPRAAVSRCYMLCGGKSSQWNEQSNTRANSETTFRETAPNTERSNYLPVNRKPELKNY